MAGVTVEQLAKQIGVESSNLIEQLNRAGVEVKKATDLVSDEQKQQLLSSLRKEHGAEEKPAKSKISLKRKSVSSLQVKNSAGRSSTVKVVNKRRRVYVKREEQEEEESSEVAVEEQVAPETKPVEAATVEDKKVTAEPKAEKSDAKDEPVAEDKANAPKAAVTKEVTPKEDAKDSKKDPKKKPKKVQQAKKSEGYSDGPKERKKTKAQLLDEDSDRGGRRRKPKSKKARVEELDVSRHAFAKPTDPVIHKVKIPETITVAELSQKMTIKAAEVIKAMMKMGVMATINQVIDQDTACLIVEEMGHKAEPVKDISIEDSIQIDYSESAVDRPPIVTVMGHVDHGKTSLLDTIRRARVTEGEAGGITQHIGAYQVKTDKGLITFLDTPGHSAFTAMRARGADCTDLVILVVAADDGVMPQTVEAIQHAKAAKVPIIVAVNKVDKEEADVSRVTNELSQHELIPESWGGDTQFVEVSAKAGTGIDDLLDSIMLQSEMLDLKAVDSGQGQGVVIESCMDRGRGAVATILVQNGSLKKGDMVLAGLEFGRVRAMMNDKGQQISEAGPSVPVEVLGLSGAPMAGDTFQVVEDERKAREVALFRQNKDRELRLSRQQASKLEGFMSRMQQGDVKNLNIILKADVQGSVEALVEALENLTNDEIIVKVVSRGVGGFNESDINLAMASQGILIGFNVRADATARRLAQQESIEINYYSVIYDVVDGVKAAISGKLGPTISEKIVGIAEVRDVFRAAKIGSIAGCMVIEGAVKRGNPIRVLRDNVVIYEGELESLRRFKDNVNEVKNNMECGIGVKNYNDVKVGDQIEVFERVEVRREI